MKLLCWSLLLRWLRSLLLRGVILGLFCAALPAQGQQVAVDILKGRGDINGVRLGFRPLEVAVDDLPVIGHIRWYVEISANLWAFGDPVHHESGFAFAISPVVTKKLTTLAGNNLFVELGIGISVVDKTRFAGRDISSHYQFEDRLGLVWSMDNRDKHSLALRYLHYSNGGFDKPNHGLDFLSLSYAYRF